MSTSVGKIVAQRNQRILLELALKPGNDACADCKARAPRWASYNLGIFICVSCASIHRKIGTHITKVKSITLDEWNKEQVEIMKENGNIKSNALFNPNEARHPPPTNMIDSERDSELEKFIRSKYEFKRFMDRKSGLTSQRPSTELRAIRSHSAPQADSAQNERKLSAGTGPPPPPKTPENLPPRLRHSATIPSLSSNAPPPARSVSRPLPPVTSSETHSPSGQPKVTQPSIQNPAGQVWEDLISLQGPSQSSSLPLQYSPVTTVMPFSPQPQVQQQPATPGNAPNPFLNLSLGQAYPTIPLVPGPPAISIPDPQFSFVPTLPLSSPALHLGTTNPFNQVSSSASVNDATFTTSSGHFPTSITVSTPATPSVQPVMAFLTGTTLHTPPLAYVPSQASAPAPAPSFLPMAFAPAHAAAAVGRAQNPFMPTGAPGQIPPSVRVTTNPFSAMQVGQVELLRTTPQMVALNEQQQQQLETMHGISRWAGPSGPGTF